MNTYKGLLYSILTSIVIGFASFWFKAAWAGTIIIALIWTAFFCRLKVSKLWGAIKNRSPLAGTLATVSCFLALGIGLGILIYRYGFELISVPSASMETAIQSGDYILVNKLVPGPRRHPSNADEYFRMAGIHPLKRGDVVLFNFPEGDTILENRPGESYYYLRRHISEFDRLREIKQWGRLIALEVEERPRFVKRLEGLPGDTFQIKGSVTYINGERLSTRPTIIKKYRWTQTKEDFEKLLPSLHLFDQYSTGEHINVEMTTGDYSELEASVKKHLKPALLEKNVPDRHIFPFDPSTGWNTHFMGPVIIPARGDTIKLTPRNLAFYQRAIRVYEGNTIEVKDNRILINGKDAEEYCFKMNYYWVMGDNRTHSFDSRYWGFLPENHIIGKIPDLFLNGFGPED